MKLTRRGDDEVFEQWCAKRARGPRLRRGRSRATRTSPSAPAAREAAATGSGPSLFPRAPWHGPDARRDPRAVRGPRASSRAGCVGGGEGGVFELERELLREFCVVGKVPQALGSVACIGGAITATAPLIEYSGDGIGID